MPFESIGETLGGAFAFANGGAVVVMRAYFDDSGTHAGLTSCFGPVSSATRLGGIDKSKHGRLCWIARALSTSTWLSVKLAMGRTETERREMR